MGDLLLIARRAGIDMRVSEDRSKPKGVRCKDSSWT
jgi:hypothetical protein